VGLPDGPLRAIDRSLAHTDSLYATRQNDYGIFDFTSVRETTSHNDSDGP